MGNPQHDHGRDGADMGRLLTLTQLIGITLAFYALYWLTSAWFVAFCIGLLLFVMPERFRVDDTSTDT